MFLADSVAMNFRSAGRTAVIPARFQTRARQADRLLAPGKAVPIVPPAERLKWDCMDEMPVLPARISVLPSLKQSPVAQDRVHTRAGKFERFHSLFSRADPHVSY